MNILPIFLGKRQIMGYWWEIDKVWKILFYFRKYGIIFDILRVQVENWIKTRGYILGEFILFFTLFFRTKKNLASPPKAKKVFKNIYYFDVVEIGEALPGPLHIPPLIYSIHKKTNFKIFNQYIPPQV